jgi:hypothetical protein
VFRCGLRVLSLSLTVLLASEFAGVEAHAPRATAAFGIALDATPETVKSLLDAQYKECRPDRLVYRHGDAAGRHTAALAINLGLAAHDPASLTPCAFSPAGDGITDSIEARFAHPEVDPDRRLYSLLALRDYPDVVYAQPPRVRTTFAEVRKALFETYGKPIEERRERVVSTAANRAVSLGLGKNIKREDYLVRYLWATEGHLPDVEPEDATCDCKGRYVKAVVEISRSPSTMPPNAFYALSVKLLVEDPELRSRQAGWNGQSPQQRR